jgi:hypothetical protein
MKAIMVDLETLSLRPTAKVLQVGVFVVDTTPGVAQRPAFDIWVSDPKGHVDPSTVAWWETQAADIRQRVFHAPEGEARQCDDELFHSLSVVYNVLGGKDAGVTVWAKPGMFDLPILTNLWEGRKPWPHYMERDLYTLARTLDPKKELQPPANGAAHVASADAEWQGLYLIALEARARALGLEVT